jgi:hypothetical protein
MMSRREHGLAPSFGARPSRIAILLGCSGMRIAGEDDRVRGCWSCRSDDARGMIAKRWSTGAYPSDAGSVMALRNQLPGSVLTDRRILCRGGRRS